MDIAFEILTPAGATIPGFDFKRPTFEWQGQKHPQGLPQCAFGLHFLLVQTPIPNHINAMLPLNIQRIDWQCYSVRGDGLSVLKRNLTGERIEWQGKGLPQLLDAILTGLKQWIVVFEINCDEIDKMVQCKANEVMPLIESSLTGRKEGFLAISI